MMIDRKTVDLLYRMNFGAFAYAAYEVVHPGEPLVPNWHIDCICHRLAGIESAQAPNRLVMNLPPRSLKSYGRLRGMDARSQPVSSDHLRELFGRSCQ
jgi:hypothetical protein